MRVSRAFPAFAAFVAWPAAAADVTAEAPAPPPLQCIWCGWYVGANVGGVWGGDPVTVNTVPAGINSIANPVVFSVHSVPAALSASGTLGPDGGGFVGGGQAGYNWQFGSWVAGLETDIQGVLGGKSFAGTGVAIAESTRGISPRVPHRTGLDTLASSGSCHQAKAAAFHC